MSPVNSEGTDYRFGGWRAAGLENWGCTAQEAELETTVDQALIRGLVTAFRVSVSGLSSV
jgi:hypothetical protein